MKIFDASSLIAFLHDMDFPAGLERLSKTHELLVPVQVRAELSHPHTLDAFNALIDSGCTRVVLPPEELYRTVRATNPRLGPGECSVIACALSGSYAPEPPSSDPVCVCDDGDARDAFPELTWVWTEQLLEYLLKKELINSDELSSARQRLSMSAFYHKGGPK